MSYTIKLLPSGHTFQAKGSQTIVEAAIDAGVHLPYGCRNGACGACKGKIVEGKVHLEDYQSAIISEEEIKNDMTLLCRAMPIENARRFPSLSKNSKYCPATNCSLSVLGSFNFINMTSDVSFSKASTRTGNILGLMLLMLPNSLISIVKFSIGIARQNNVIPFLISSSEIMAD